MQGSLLRLAYVSPHRTGKDVICSRSQRLMAFLSGYYRISLVVSEEKVDSRKKECEILTYRDFRKRLKEFDRILCHFERDLTPMLSLIEEIPYVALFHDLFLADLIDLSQPEEHLRVLFEEAYYSHGWSCLVEMKRDLSGSLRKYPLNARIINNSIGVILTSSEALRVIKTFYREVKDKSFKILREEELARTPLLFYEAIEEFYEKSAFPEFLAQVSKSLKKEKDFKRSALLVKKNFSPIVRDRNLLVDVSAVSLSDLGTGIQRVVKAQLKGLIESPSRGFRIEPVRIAIGTRTFFRYARNYTRSLLGIENRDILPDSEVVFRKGDIYYAPDLYVRGVVEAHRKGLFDKLRLTGVKIAFLVYDLLPIEFPRYFPPGVSENHARYLRILLQVSDLIVCISGATKESLKEFARREGIERDDLKIEVLHLGSEIEEARHKAGLTSRDIEVLKRLTENRYFLMVSTVEPRKGHYQTVKAFERLWEKGLNLSLVIVGREGWMVEELIKYVKGHRELNKRLFWTGYVSDEVLEGLYKNALATIVASEGEGFGLAIIESARYRTPVIARDIPVFREIAENGAYYFPDTKNPEDLSEAIEQWLSLYKENRHPRPEGIKSISWKEHIERLKQILLED